MSYYPACKESFESIKDALESINEDSSFNNRKKIAILNGIKDYQGSPEQNIDLLNRLKQGKLLKSAGAKSSGSGSGSTGSSGSFEQKIKNIENSNDFGNKKKAMVIIGNILLKKGYETVLLQEY